TGSAGDVDEEDEEGDAPAKPNARPKQSILNFRYSLFDPNRLLTTLEPKLRFLWTRGFFIASAAFILLASLVLWSNRGDLASAFAQQRMGWELAVIVWLTVIAVTTLHEFAHG